LRLLALLLGTGLLAGLTACHPGSVENVEELDIVVTNYVKDADFASIQTYAMPDTVVDLGEFIEGDVMEWDRSLDQTILTVTATNMDALYTRILPNPNDPDNPWSPWTGNPNGTEPDVILLAGGLTGVGTLIFTGWTPWWPGWGWFPPGWGWGGYPWVGTQEFRTGTIILNMLNFEEADEENLLLPGIWQSALDGVAEGGNGEQRVTRGIDQAFKQSPYLAGN
jgi:hypothetical protein